MSLLYLLGLRRHRRRRQLALRESWAVNQQVTPKLRSRTAEPPRTLLSTALEHLLIHRLTLWKQLTNSLVPSTAGSTSRQPTVPLEMVWLMIPAPFSEHS